MSPLDCTGCELCVRICPADALFFEETDKAVELEAENWNYAISVPNKGEEIDKTTVKGSQFQQPLLEFSGACEGCGETPYVKLLTQLLGDRLVVANATGCSSIWGASAPSFPYTVNARGEGPAWANSLFEDNAEFGLGMRRAFKQRRNQLMFLVSKCVQGNHLSKRCNRLTMLWRIKLCHSVTNFANFSPNIPLCDMKISLTCFCRKEDRFTIRYVLIFF